MNRNKMSRYDLLLTQFQINHVQIMNEEVKASLTRFFSFLYEHTELHYLVFIRQDELIQYLQYHLSLGFKQISFVQAMKDIKVFLQFLEYKFGSNSVPKIDFSLKNIQLWMKL